MNTLYIDKDSFIHSLDPRIKLLFFILSALLVFFLNLLGILFYSLFTFCMVLISFSYKNIYRVKFIMISIFLFSFLIWALTNQSGVMLFGPFSTGGIELGLISGLRLILLMSIGVMFISTTRIEDLSVALVKIGFPYKIVFSFTTALRLIPLIISSVDDIKNAQKLRGIGQGEKKRSPIRQLKEQAPLIIPVITKTLKRTNDLAIALEVKCFGLFTTRSFYNSISFTKRDFVFLIVLFAALLISLLLRRF
jgi:energy-coupling factor transport system permease protein